MLEHERLARLRELAAELERLPPSEARDALLSQVRSRCVALETGSEPSVRWSTQSPPQAAASVDIATDLRRAT